MSTVKFKRFTKPQFLKQIGRDFLGQFFTRFSPELAEKKITLPAATLGEDDYYEALSRVALSPDGLPEKLIEAAYAIEGMANDEGEDRLERATGEGGLAFQFRDDSTAAEKAMQAWLTNPELFAEKFSEQQLARLSAFDYHGSRVPTDRTETFEPPTPQALELMTADMEAAFRKKNRGQRTCRIEVHPMDGEYWFLIRHGDSYTRVPTVRNGQISVLHFRPAKDDVAVYSPQGDEIRIHAGTKWEKELYRTTIGERLFGEPNHFSERKSYTLEPLRVDGVDALDVSDVPGISSIVLREIEVAWPGEFGDAMIRKSTDVLASAAARETEAFPTSGRLVRAAFDIYFGDNPKPRKVQLRPPNILKLGRHCDARLVQRWLVARGFRAGSACRTGQQTGAEAANNHEGITHVERLALP
jgi:hypothetical protein